MKSKKQLATIQITVLLVVLTLTSCASKQETPVNDQLAIENILVLPVDISSNQESATVQTTNKSLEQGRDILIKTINQYFLGNSNIAFISPEKQDTLLHDYNQNRLRQAMSIGEQLAADAVLISQIVRYQEREGKKYAVKTPASLAFKYRLLETKSGQTLCVGSYDVSQRPWTENFLSFKKTINRGGKWIKGEELAIEAVNEKFSSCNYFKH